MLFNSLDFALFLPIVFILYWFVFNKSVRQQNAFVVVMSYFFYGYWDWRFCMLMVVSSISDYLIGLILNKTDRKYAKSWLGLSLFINLGILGFFKYYNFFIDSFTSTFRFFGFTIEESYTLQIILPIGISFYTFQTLSYTIDIYRRQIKPTKDILAFFSFVSFFPQLVAGPIEKARNLLPQFLNKRVFDEEKAKDGLRQILAGFIKKLVIADNLSEYTIYIVENYAEQSASVLLLGILSFAIQVYCDFSGYSDIAIGTARLFGISLSTNFKTPFFSQNMAILWRKWHISLGLFLKDYLYIPLRKLRGNTFPKTIALLLTFTICGLWHGAGWSFVIFGVINGVLCFPKLTPKPSASESSPRAIILMLITASMFSMLCFLALGFDMEFYFSYYTKLFSRTLFWDVDPYFMRIFYYVIPLLLIEWFTRRNSHFLEIKGMWLPFRWSVYLICVFGIIRFGNFHGEEFFYFQF